MKIKEMEREEIVESLEFAMVEVLCKDISGLDEIIMKNNIKSFINNVVESYESKEILEKFNTPEESIRRFLEYLENYIGTEDNSGHTLH